MVFREADPLPKKSLLVALSVLALAVAPTAVHAATPTGADRITAAKQKVDARVKPKSAQDDTNVHVIVEMAGDPVAVEQAKAERTLTDDEKSKIRANLKAKQDAVRGDIAAKGGKVTAAMQSAYNGLAVTVPRNQTDALASLSGVVAVHAAPTQTIDNAVSVPYLGTYGVWQNTGYTGKGVKVAVIDTGIDYTQADFAGPGTVDAFKAAKATSATAADPSLFGPNAPRVKGGTDLVGDDYDADDPTSVPKPDPNPLDCQGHGSHVAGTIGGGGITENGAKYVGPYDASTASKSFRVGPGVAPQVDLYAVRVFGCSGTTDVTTQAIDWAVSQNMDVINMSLGSPFGMADDPSAVAASNAVGAGVVVVSSSGNEGSSPYLTGSPATGRGVISVAAIDSTKDFPGAQLTFADGTKMAAINANGVNPLPAGPFKVVVLTDDPATAENESLGCSQEAYTKAGIAAGQNQLAVARRGDCARVAKAIFAQQAGAAAALMINNAESYPPYEGTITANPDTEEPYNVTIPFLGVRSTDAAALVAQNGKTVTLASNRLSNPAYTGYADFSSAGARFGDSGLKPSVSAPGVSIVSAAVGTGNEGTVLSGTSMAAPHVAGVAALTKQAHPRWGVQDLTAAITSTADPDKTAGYRLTLGGGGQVDVAQAVGTQTVALGDLFMTTSGLLRESALNFGFAETSGTYCATKEVVVKNNGKSAVTYKVSAAATSQSRKASVTFDRSSVTVPAGGRASVKVTIKVKATDVGSSEGSDFQFFEVSGNVVLTAASGTLRVPYLVVPRATSDVTVKSDGKVTARGFNQTFKNSSTVAGSLDFYVWGLSDPQDVRGRTAPGIDVRAVGAAPADSGDPADPYVVFAINNWTRASNEAANEFDVSIDTNGDSKADYIVFSADFGLVATGEVNGRSATFILDMASGDIFMDAYTIAPTDSSTLLLPVLSSSLGLTKAKGSFTYWVESYSLLDDTKTDTVNGRAIYNPFKSVLGEGTYFTLKAGASKSVSLPIDVGLFNSSKALGQMVVVFDNAAGPAEALLTGKAR